jgi:hypothetical protein
MPVMAQRSVKKYLQLLCLVGVLFLGMLLRLGTAGLTIVDHPVRNDAMDYFSYAWNLKTSGVYSSDFSTFIRPSAAVPAPDAVRPPAYPWLLRALMWGQVNNSFLNRVVYAQAWIAGLTLLCTILLVVELFGAWAGLAVGALVAVSPHQSVYVGYLLTETLYGALLMFAVAAGVLALKLRHSKWRYAMACLSGVLFGLSCLCRSTLNQWPVFLLLLLLLPSVRPYKREILALAVGFVLMMSPWWIRNELTVHRLSDDSKMLETVQQGSYPQFMYDGKPESFGYPYRFDPNAVRAQSSWGNVIADMKAKFLRDPVGMISWYAFGKTANFFSWTTQQGWRDIFEYPVVRSPWLQAPLFVGLASLMWWLYIPLICCGLLGTFVAFMPRTRARFNPFQVAAIRWIALLHLFAIAVHVAGAPFARYSVPFRPITFLLAVFLIVWIVRGFSVRTPGSAGSAAVE